MLSNPIKLVTRNMKSFTQILNPISGKTEWKILPEDYDYHQEIARSAFADMLHDTERNKRYYQAIKDAVNALHKNGLKANVLDIGTGTGLLSMMSVIAGADSVVACEAFLPMANCAEKIIEKNGFADKIRLIKKRSTKLKVGINEDIKNRMNLLVTEVFDTELIGEGAIEIFNHAHENLLEPGSIVIPSSANVYVQLIESPMILAWNKIKVLANSNGEILLKTPNEINKCQGHTAVHDIQLNQIPPSNFKLLTEAIKIFHFDWSTKDIAKNKTSVLSSIAKRTGYVNALFFWWELNMCHGTENLLSCAPFWIHPERYKDKSNLFNIQENIPWRDHWMQAIYYIPKKILAYEKEQLNIIANHDEYSFWFDVNSNSDNPVEKYHCTCSFHLAYSRTRIGQLNDSLRNKKYLNYFEEILTENSKILTISDGSILGLSIIKLGVVELICIESNRTSRNVIELYIKENSLKNITVLDSIDKIENFDSITNIIGEPYFLQSILPWDNFYFGTQISKFKHKFHKNVQITPARAIIYAIPVEFENLHKIKTPIRTCEGFDLSFFDNIISSSSVLVDALVEAQPLWEYPCKALAKEQQVLSVDFVNFLQTKSTTGFFVQECPGTCNGIALWVDWKLDESNNRNTTITTGAIQPIQVGNNIVWDIYSRQGVHFFTESNKSNSNEKINWRVDFNPNDGEINFRFYNDK